MVPNQHAHWLNASGALQPVMGPSAPRDCRGIFLGTRDPEPSTAEDNYLHDLRAREWSEKIPWQLTLSPYGVGKHSPNPNPLLVSSLSWPTHQKFQSRCEFGCSTESKTTHVKKVPGHRASRHASPLHYRMLLMNNNPWRREACSFPWTSIPQSPGQIT